MDGILHIRSLLVSALASALSFCTLLAPPADADTYHVSPSGDDSNSGALARPWRTIGKAARTLKAGDTVYLMNGVYREQVVPSNSGSPGAYIKYAAYPGHVAVIDGGGLRLPDYDGLFNVVNKAYIWIEGLYVKNAGPHFDNAGIMISRCSHVVVKLNHTYNTASSGIGVWRSSDVTVDGNEVELACNDGQQECITIAITDGFEMKNNLVHHGGPGNNGGEGIDIKDGSSNGRVFNNLVHHTKRIGIYIDAWDKHTYNIQVYGNIVHDCASSGFAIAAEAGGLLENVDLFNNVAYTNYFCGLVLGAWGERGADHPMKDIRIYNNTFYDNGSSEWGGGISLENDDVEGLVVRNNILSRNYMFQMQCEVPTWAFAIDHNLIDGFRNYSDEIRGASHVEGDPRFAAAAAADFRLRSGSSAVDAGTSVGAPGWDFDFGRRPSGKGVDIGAFELESRSAIAAPKKLKAKLKGGRIFLRWKDRSSNETGFIVERRRGRSGDWQVIGDTPADTKSFSDYYAEPGATYQYRVRGFDGDCYSFPSDVATVTPGM